MTEQDGMALLRAKQTAAGPTRDSARPIGDTLPEILARAQARPPDPAAEERQREHERRRQCARMVAQLAKDLGRRFAADCVGLDRYEVYDPTQAEALERIRQFGGELPDFVGLEAQWDGRGLLLYGSVGTGKDHLVSHLLWRAAHAGISCRFVYAQDLFASLRDCMGDRDGTESGILHRWSWPNILAISDPIPPSRPPTDYQVETLYRLVNARYHAKRPTWMTLNAQDPDAADQALTSQVFDRLQDEAELVPCFWPSYRERRRRA